jgi:hypothetical protein
MITLYTYPQIIAVLNNKLTSQIEIDAHSEYTNARGFPSETLTVQFLYSCINTKYFVSINKFHFSNIFFIYSQNSTVQESLSALRNIYFTMTISSF